MFFFKGLKLEKLIEEIIEETKVPESLPYIQNFQQKTLIVENLKK